jgi:class 3 adenylate cyclase/Flp pilus assembly protein TadD
MGTTVGDRLQEGRHAYERHAWYEAFEAFRQADQDSPLAAADLEVLAQAAWFAGHPGAAIEARERAHAGYVKDGDRGRAAETALQLALDHLERLETAIGNGWLRRAKRLLDGLPSECPAHGWQAITLCVIALRIAGDAEEALRQARRAEEVGARFDHRSLHAMGLELQGVALVALGQIDEGMALIDEATVSAVTGELDPMTTGVIYCSTIDVCRNLADWRRAGEWTDAAERWCERQGISGFPGICRVHRAEIMHFRGSWADAEREARRASEELAKYDLIFTGRAHYEIGEVRLRVGDLTGAREAFRQAHELSCPTEPGMSLLRLAQGDVAAAHTSIRRALTADGSQTFAKVRLLPAAVEIGLAAGDRDTVREAVAELEKISRSFRTTAMDATVASARGRLLLAEGDLAAAVPALRRAVELWHEIGSPYEAARARTALGEAFRREGDEGAARLEFDTAKSAFEQLGAMPDARRVAELLGGGEGIAARTGERVTRTFVFTDIVGSTPLVEALGDDAWEELIRWHDQNLRATFDRHGGNEVRHTGDGFFVVFQDAPAAIEAAVAIQRTLAEHRKAHGFAPQVRIGLHQAEASIRAMDYAGQAVHQAARIGSLAEGGQILASRETVAGSARFPVSEPRSVTLKGVSEPVEVVSIDWR